MIYIVYTRIRAAIFTVSLGFALFLTWNGPAWAENCKPQMLLTSLDMAKSKSGRILIPARFGDTEKYLLLDTGGAFGTIAWSFAKAQDFSLRHSAFGQIDATGTVTNQIARVGSFYLGRIHASGIDFAVAHDAGDFGEDNADVVGILGPNFLQGYDVELDNTHHKVNFLSPDHCKGKVIYWPAQAVAAIPLRITKVGHIFFKANLDGHDYQALLDTGAAETTMTIPVAERDFGLKLGSPDAPAAGFVNGQQGIAAYRHTFAALSFDGIAVKNPAVIIAPDMTAQTMAQSTVSIGTRLPAHDGPVGMPDLTVGNDILQKLHVYIDYKEKMLYLTP